MQLGILASAAVCWRATLRRASRDYTEPINTAGANPCADLPAPDAPPIDNGTVLVRDGRIAAVDVAARIPIPRDAKVIDCTGLIVVAGFQNSHVHFMGTEWRAPRDSREPNWLPRSLQCSPVMGSPLRSRRPLLWRTRRRFEDGSKQGSARNSNLDGWIAAVSAGRHPFYLIGVLPPAMLALLISRRRLMKP